jgi:hypothetical protein
MVEAWVPPELEALLRRAYGAFNDRDVDAVLAVLHPEVDWPNVLGGTRLHGHAAVHDYWAGQFATTDPRVEPEGFHLEPDGRIAIDVHQVVRDLAGALLAEGRVQHVYRFRDGLVDHMEVRPA